MTSQNDRQQAILEILHFIQDGGDFNQAKKMFQAKFKDVDVAEITSAERELIKSGLNPMDIQALCNVHVALFKDNLKPDDPYPEFNEAGHPVNTIKLENTVIRSLVEDYLIPKCHKYEQNPTAELNAEIRQGLKDLKTIDKHYKRKEAGVFALMNKYGITAPPQVMWGVDDDIRRLIKEANDASDAELVEKTRQACNEVMEMIFKEEKIMLPMVAQVATSQDWGRVRQSEDQIGYTLINQPINWKPQEAENDLTSAFIQFAEGELSTKQLNLIMDYLPLAITFVDENDIVKYFGGGQVVFPHSAASVGLNVYDCHPVIVRHKVKKIIEDLRSGRKDLVESWIKFKKKFIYIRYYALRDKNNQFCGTLEICEDVTRIRELSGTNRPE
ncbi:MAG: DUF438 domain-containing protein [Lactobacillus sp.]|nr:DUF438 domain-containing protein [Lactobacillus sp.]